MLSPIALAERGLVPDPLLRFGIRQLVRQRLREERARERLSSSGSLHDFVAELRKSPIALLPETANQQHYEVPAEFFAPVLGARLKYSCAFWPTSISNLDAAEEAMLALSTERAELEDGMEILELGCGWGSLTLWLAERFPASRILGVSNSRSQRAFIEERARARGLSNVAIETADMNDFTSEQRFDRVVSVEMFEHMRNYDRLLARIGSWLRPGGKLFVHVFAHRHHAYPFEDAGGGDWMARNFFTGGLMPSEDLLLHFQRDLVLEERWRISGLHYQRTANAWLANLDARTRDLLPVLGATYGEADAQRWLQRWRIFFLACAEMFGFRGGEAWGVAHYRMAKRAPG
jgi:cyclopropane-fatty-acyl-phospholipid synthase